MQFELLFLSSLALLASSAAIGPLHHHDWSQSDRQFYSAVNAIRTASPSLSCTMPSPSDMPSSALPPPSPGLSVFHVAVGRGTQNYSCPAGVDPSTAPIALGALANLYNVTCMASACTHSTPPSYPLTSVPSILAQNALPSSQDPSPIHPLGSGSLLTGHHYFTNATLPTFNLVQASTNTNFGIYFTSKKYNVSAPAGSALGSDGSAAVPWLKLNVVTPDAPPLLVVEQSDYRPGVKEVYRVNTAGGSAPSSCVGKVGTTFVQQYAAEYWFWGS